MRFLRLLAVPLLASIPVARGIAQSGVVQAGPAQSRLAQSAPLPPDQSPLATPSPFRLQPRPGHRPFSLNSGAGTSLFAPQPATPGFNQKIPPLQMRRYNQFLSGQDPNILFQLAMAQKALRTVIVTPSEVCYTVREYTFTRDNPQSDATTMKDYSACRPANDFHLKGAGPGSPR